jgi:DNA-binding NarL/FixJ family response regulator
MVFYRTNQKSRGSLVLRAALIDGNREDLETIRSAVQRAPDLSLEFTTDSFIQLIVYMKHHSMDLLIFGADGFFQDHRWEENLKKIIEYTPGLRVLVLSYNEDPRFVSRVIKLGASGFLSKAELPEKLNVALTMIKKYGVFLDARYQGHLLREIRQLYANDLISLGTILMDMRAVRKVFSERELEIFQALVSGMSTAEMCKTLFISESTLKNHISHMLKKTGTESRTQLIALAFKKGWLLKT